METTRQKGISFQAGVMVFGSLRGVVSKLLAFSADQYRRQVDGVFSQTTYSEVSPLVPTAWLWTLALSCWELCVSFHKSLSLSFSFFARTNQSILGSFHLGRLTDTRVMTMIIFQLL